MITNLQNYLRRIASFMLLIFSVVIFASCSKDETDDTGAGDTPGNEETPSDNNSGIKFIKGEDDTFGFEIKDDNGSNYATQPTPAIIRIKSSDGKEKIYKSGYQEVSTTSDGFTCSATISSVHRYRQYNNYK